MKRITGVHLNIAEFCRIVEEKTEEVLAKNQKHNSVSLWLCDFAKRLSENDPILCEYGMNPIKKDGM
jgi:hypothetical protein